MNHHMNTQEQELRPLESVEPSIEVKTDMPAAPEAAEFGIEQESSMQVEQEQNLAEKITALTKKIARPKKKKNTTIPQVRDNITSEVEKILEDGLVDAYRSLSRVEQQEFKIKGEQVTFQIRQMMQSSRLRIKTVFELIYEWLRLLPGVNKFFLEQEAKIKADSIAMIHRRMHHRH